MGDELRLRQVLVNLLSNAVKYKRQGGSIRLSAELRPGGRVLLRVADTGLGMSEQQMAHLFEPFNRLGREQDSIEGAGIGLVLTRNLLELMGASMSLQSAPGEGTTVELDLPLATAAPGLLTLPPELPPQAPPRARLLCIEDNPVNQQIVLQALASWPGVSVHLADTAAQGLQQARELMPDLILLDMRLPDSDGIEVLARLRAEPALAAIKVVALSASAMPEEVELAKAGGALEYWTKPIQLQRFLEGLRRLLA